MKKLFGLIITIVIFAFATNINLRAEPTFAPNSKSAILIEATTGRIIFEKDADTPYLPASITKVMTLILVYEDLESGKITMDDMVVTPEEASELGGSQIYLATGEEMRLEDLLKSVAIGSANDAAMSLAVHVAGSEEEFVSRMNKKAEELGMNNTHFVNPYGFDDPQHYASARDVGIMSAYLINKYPQVLNYTSMYENYVREDNLEKKFWLVNTNKLVKFMKGVDGLKTGWTPAAKYSITATILKNDVRFIAVVMACDNPDLRTQDVVGLLNYATSNYDVHSYLKKGDVVTTLEDVLIQPSKYNVVVNEDINILKRKGDKVGEIKVEIKIDNLKIQSLEEIIGTIDVYYEGKLYKTADLVLLEKVHKSTFFDVCIEILRELFFVS